MRGLNKYVQMLSNEINDSSNKIFIAITKSMVIRGYLVCPDCDKYYNFTVLACQMNEQEDGVAPTDSRNRPDQRLMEEGKWDEANAVKIELEEKQRAARRQRESSAEQATSGGQPYPPYEPVWFKKETEPITGNIVHVFKGDYWTCKENADWSRCPNIF
uniref:Uncharacterized protein n=1 Tax=Rhodnius prolixus TaxID=13249 RepID=T1HZJ1_RHOPR